MKKIMITALITLINTQVHSADFRDAMLKGTSNFSGGLMDVTEDVFEKTKPVSDYTAEKTKAIISKGLEASAKTSQSVTELAVKVLDVSRPMFKFTADGLAVVFEFTGKASGKTVEKTQALYVLIGPSSDVTMDVISDLLEVIGEVTSDGSELVSKIVNYIEENFGAPFRLTSKGTEKIFELISEGSEGSTEISNSILGKDNVEAGFELTGRGISLTSEGITNVIYALSRGTESFSNLFALNNIDKEEVEKAVERGDDQAIASIIAFLRADIDNRVKGGDILNKLISDEEMKVYMNVLLAMSSK